MTDATCPECGGVGEHTRAVESLSDLYDHRDDYAQCLDCGHIWAYRGAALDDAEQGLTFYDAEARTAAERPVCEEHGRRMVPTKVWPSEGRVQFKCEEPVDGEDGRCQRLTTEDLVPV